MKALGYEVCVECRCSPTCVTKVVAGVCSGDCPAGLSGQCVHVAAVLIAAVNVLRPLQLDFEPPSTAGGTALGQGTCIIPCDQSATFLLHRRI